MNVGAYQDEKNEKQVRERQEKRENRQQISKMLCATLLLLLRGSPAKKSFV